MHFLLLKLLYFDSSGDNDLYLCYFIQFGAVITQYNITCYSIYHCSDWSRIEIRVWTHKRHPIPHPNLCVNFGEQGKSEGFDSCDWPTKSYSNWIQITNFSPCVTFKFDGWPWKTVGHLFYTMSSFAHHFKTIGEFKLKLQSRNAQFGSKSAIFCPCDLEIWWITLERASLLQYVKLCALFERHPWIQIRVTVQKR